MIYRFRVILIYVDTSAPRLHDSTFLSWGWHSSHASICGCGTMLQVEEVPLGTGAWMLIPVWIYYFSILNVRPYNMALPN
jgi:hypothetical protein